ncbi:unnamed protein product [Adineta ricciae]|uniref:Uncharacterized protein n=1 Tax=Adineta ricciae TaxID=249248 RepID=A0A816FY85_ADIRI|nr:unnamed protein product [Adineta ricciae]
MLFACFDHLTAYEIYESFSKLNTRCDDLIDNIGLYLDFTNTSKTKFDKFCLKLLSNPRIKDQIRCLKLSNNFTCKQIDAFLSFFSLDEFSHLRLLSLSGINDNHLKMLKSTLSSTSQLSAVYLESQNSMNEIFSPTNV